MQISVLQCDWGDAELCDIKALLRDAASHLNRVLRTPFTGVINVNTASADDDTPRTLFRSAPGEPFVIQLTTRNRRWNQFAFQFTHEFCHVLSDYERLKDNPNNWFHESICELASVFSLRRMAERWPTDPPFPHWSDYAHLLKEYADKRLARENVKLPVGMSLHEWLASNEEVLRRDPYQRDKNELVAYALLPTFESCPLGWNAIARFPSSSSAIVDYLSEWQSSVEAGDRPFVANLSSVLCR